MIYAELYLKDDFFKILRQTKSLLNSKTIYIKSLLTTFISALNNSLQSLQGDPNQNLKFVLAITLNLKINLHLTNTFGFINIGSKMPIF